MSCMNREIFCWCCRRLHLFSSYCTLASIMCVCVCVHACFHIVLHGFGVSGTLITPLEHMLAYLSLFVPCSLVLARLR